MLDTLTGFAVVALAVVVGYILGRIGLLGPHAREVLSRLTFFVLSPFLLFVVLANADVRMLFSSLLPVSAIAALAMFVIFIVLARVVWRRNLGETIIGTLASGQVNSNNIGIPLSLYLLGNAAYPAPVIMMQMVIFTPITLALLDFATKREGSVGRTILRALTNPMIIASGLGMAVALSGVTLPPIVIEPFTLIANACVPVLLISYGISLYGQKVLGAAGHRRDIVVASVLKLFIMPLVAWALAQFVFGLTAQEVLIITVLAALPSAQNIFNYAQRYDVGETIARDTVFITTVGCLPVLFVITLLLG